MSPIILRNELHSRFGVFLHKSGKGYCFKCSDSRKVSEIRRWLLNSYSGKFATIYVDDFVWVYSDENN